MGLRPARPPLHVLCARLPCAAKPTIDCARSIAPNPHPHPLPDGCSIQRAHESLAPGSLAVGTGELLDANINR